MLDLKDIGTEAPVDITDFDAVANCAEGHKFELKETDGITGTGIVLTIIGKHADPVNKWVNKIINQSMREQHMAARKGKTSEPKSLDELREQNIDGACVRVIGWSGVKQPFSVDLLKSALKRNPHWVDQIVEESDDLGNFSTKQ